MDREPLAARLLATFLDELEEQLRVLDAELLALEAGSPDAEHLRAVFRVMHTLKGAARAAGVRPIEELCHALETRLLASRESGALRAGDLPLLFSASDALADAGRRLRAGERLEGGPLIALGHQLRGAIAAPPGEAGRPSPAPGDAAAGGAREQAIGPAHPSVASRQDVPATPPVETHPPDPQPDDAQALDTRVAERRGADARVVDSRATETPDQVRLAGRQMEALVGAAGDVLAVSSAIAGRPATAAQLYDALEEWRRDWRRARRTIDAALERGTGATEATGAFERLDETIRTIARDAARLSRALSDDARTLTGTASRFQDSVRRLRMRPFADIVEALPRAARDVAVELGKEVRLVVEGQDVEADRAVLDALREPLLQLVRNAVDHGIESAEDRARAGKPAAGTVTVAAGVRGDQLIVTVHDDGAGIDIAGVRAALARRGDVAAANARDSEVARTLLDGGISTRTTATSISGRGVGLDIVRATTERLGGTIDATSRAGQGTTFTLGVPVDAATVRALVVRAGTMTLAIPASAAQRALRIRRDRVRVAQGQLVVPVADVPVPLLPLARVLDLAPNGADAGAPTVTAVLVEHGTRRALVVVDDVLDERELVVRALEHVDDRTAARYTGAALLDATHVALVVNPGVLVGAFVAADLADRTAQEAPRRRILVVDDSITTRTLEQSVLTAAGYDVVTAIDGIDGWRHVEAGGIDLVLTDVEMPRLDGIALCERIRAAAAHASLPVIMVTSLDRPEERERGLEAGADAYVTKSSFDQDALLSIVEQLLEERS